VGTSAGHTRGPFVATSGDFHMATDILARLVRRGLSGAGVGGLSSAMDS
jgi:hypothetical protein